MNDRNRAFIRPVNDLNSSDYVNNLRAKIKFSGTSNLARTVAAQGGLLPLRTPGGRLKPYQGTYGFSATTVTPNSKKTYCLNTSRSYHDLLDITKGKYLLTPPNPTLQNITLDDIEPSELYNGVYFENTYTGNGEAIYSTSAFGTDYNQIIYDPLTSANQEIFVDPSYNMFYDSQSCLLNETQFRNIKIRTDLGVEGKSHLDRMLNSTLLNGFTYPTKFSLEYTQYDCINSNNDIQTPPAPSCPPCSLDTIAIEGPTNTWTTNSNVTILSCQTLTILVGQTLNIENNLNNYGTIQNSGTILTSNGLFTNYSGGIINNNVGGVINTNLGAGFLQNDLGGTINNNGTITANAVATSYGTINNNATGLINILGNVLASYGIITNNTGGVISVGSGLYIYGGILTNHIGATITNSGTIINDSTFTNYGIITNVLVIQNLAPLTNDGASATITNAGTITNFSGGTITNTNSATINNNIGGNITNSNGAIINNKFSGIITNNSGATFANTTATFNNYSVTESAVFTNNGTYTGNPPILL